MDCVSCIDLYTVSYNYRTIVPIFSVLQVWKLVKCVVYSATAGQFLQKENWLAVHYMY